MQTTTTTTTAEPLGTVSDDMLVRGLTPAWHEAAACAESTPDAYFGRDADGIQRCQHCPVAKVCFWSAMLAEEDRPVAHRFGVFGGARPAARARINQNVSRATMQEKLAEALRAWAASPDRTVRSGIEELVDVDAARSDKRKAAAEDSTGSRAPQDGSCVTGSGPVAAVAGGVAISEPSLRLLPGGSEQKASSAGERRARRQSAFVAAERTRSRLVALHRRGVVDRVVAERAGVGIWTVWGLRNGRRPRVRTETARAVGELWEDYCAPRARTRMWDAAPLVAALEARYGSLTKLGDESQRRHLYRASALREQTAEAYAMSHGWLPHEIWPDWFDIDEDDMREEA